MDPDQTLVILREAIRNYERAPSGSAMELSFAIDALKAAEELDEWLTKGGFLPRAWGYAGQGNQERT